ncbi:[citrate (pro-3S)-lyase] ligase [Anaeromicrobium sediminis]|uniref:[citrate (pro-3S)-lyase] ligase n=1 Tax=Anaeromicrobium sediminis TaxID=1478221 RepID=UPI0015956AFF|nr:[citrate (pro-3S)-lyase] ligase [Anaeromicrobium sediminis]
MEFSIREILIYEEIVKAEELLSRNNLSLGQNLDHILGIYNKGQLIGTGGIKGNTLRCIAIDQSYKGTNVLNKLISELIKIQYFRGNTHIFIFTKPSAKGSFNHMGFYEIEEVKNEVVLMENRKSGLEEYLKSLRDYKTCGEDIGAIVMNGNPFTLGHRYLIERAAEDCDHLHIFVLSSEKSTFSHKVRYDLIKKGTEHIKNITVHSGGPYIISEATFPTYFMKEKSDKSRIHAILDSKIFSKNIGPSLGINTRYVGDEPYCKTTNMYNNILKEILPSHNIDLKVIKRKSHDHKPISASLVRDYMKNEEYEKIKNLVPNTTYNYLVSEEGKKIIKKIKGKEERH